MLLSFTKHDRLNFYLTRNHLKITLDNYCHDIFQLPKPLYFPHKYLEFQERSTQVLGIPRAFRTSTRNFKSRTSIQVPEIPRI